MIEMNALPEGWRPRLEAYLDRVERARLSGGVARGVRQSLVERLGSELMDRVASAQKEGQVKPENLEKILATVDSGQTAEAVPDKAAARNTWLQDARHAAPRRSKCAYWGAVCIALSLLPMAVILFVLSFFSPSGPHIEAYFPHDGVHAEIGSSSASSDSQGTTQMHFFSRDGQFRALTYWQHPLEQFWWMLIPISPLALAGTLLGWIAVLEVGFSKGRATGGAVALFDSLFYPMLLAAITFWIWYDATKWTIV